MILIKIIGAIIFMITIFLLLQKYGHRNILCMIGFHKKKFEERTGVVNSVRLSTEVLICKRCGKYL